MDIYCARCDIEFEGKIWYGGECPSCGRRYEWEEYCTEDYSDCWVEVYWEENDE